MKNVIIIVIAVIVFLIAGVTVCFAMEKESTPTPANNAGDDLALEPSGDFQYFVDKRTGVVYLMYFSKSGKRMGMTVMLNADGTPVTADQVGLTWDEND